jgi:hypothetical protein
VRESAAQDNRGAIEIPFRALAYSVVALFSTLARDDTFFHAPLLLRTVLLVLSGRRYFFGLIYNKKDKD